MEICPLRRKRRGISAGSAVGEDGLGCSPWIQPLYACRWNEEGWSVDQETREQERIAAQRMKGSRALRNHEASRRSARIGPSPGEVRVTWSRLAARRRPIISSEVSWASRVTTHPSPRTCPFDGQHVDRFFRHRSPQFLNGPRRLQAANDKWRICRLLHSLSNRPRSMTLAPNRPDDRHSFKPSGSLQNHTSRFQVDLHPPRCRRNGRGRKRTIPMDLERRCRQQRYPGPRSLAQICRPSLRLFRGK